VTLRGRPSTPEYERARNEQATYGIAEYVFASWDRHREQAGSRGIPFRFSVFQWDQWWKRELHDLDRAKFRRGGYRMARHDDVSGYEDGNVYAAPVVRAPVVRVIKERVRPSGDHLRLGNRHPRARPVVTDRGEFMSIRLASLAFGVSDRTGRKRVRRGEWRIAA